MPDLSDDETSAEDDARIRSLLADVADPEPLPDDVAARLDDRLAMLVAERSDAAAAPAVRRAGRARTLLVAAAAVAVVGAGIPALRALDSGSDGVSGASGSASSAQDSGGRTELREDPSGPQDSLSGDRALPALSTATFARDARRVLGTARGATAPPAATGCGRLDQRPDGVRTVLAVSVDGRLALLEVYAPADGVRRVVAVSCAGRVLAATRLTAG